MAKPLTIALIQAAYPGSVAAALDKAEALCVAAAGRGADIAVFPEMWTIGYRFFDPAEPGARERWLGQALHEDEEPLLSFAGVARRLGMAIAITYLRRNGETPENSCVLFDRNGRVALRYSKVHTCIFEAERYCGPGNDFPVAELEIGDGETVKVGIMICYDREFPEPARILTLNGAEVILVPNACEMEHHRTAQLMTRAFENAVGIAMTNWPAPQCNGHSMVIDAAFFGSSGEALDPLRAEGGKGEEIVVGTLDLDALRAYRRATIWGTTFRRGETYGRLAVADPLDPARLAEIRINGNTKIATLAGRKGTG
jgi:predicted amidohydrolase